MWYWCLTKRRSEQSWGRCNQFSFPLAWSYLQAVEGLPLSEDLLQAKVNLIVRDTVPGAEVVVEFSLFANSEWPAIIAKW
jgi:hypothetical protein